MRQKLPKLSAESNLWQIVIMDPDGNWIHWKVDDMLVSLAKSGRASYLGLEAERAAQEIVARRA